MFTGIVEELGRAVKTGGRLLVSCTKVAEDSGPGASVSVNGVCLTVVDRRDGTIAFDLADETLRRSSLGSLRPGDPVNLERPVTLLARLAGHVVQGHVDGVGRVADTHEARTGRELTIEVPEGLMPYIAEKGSVAVDGVSLTVAQVLPGGFAVALVPFTLAATTFGSRGIGDPVNVEVDVMAKYVESLSRRTT
jgi:riboflavin synthase